MRAGFGKAELTPPLGVELAGYGYYLQRRAAAVTDPLYARALLLEQGEQRALLVSCEVLGLSRPVCDAVIRHAREALGCAEAAVTIVSVHTHTGPAIQYHEGCGEVNEAYVGRRGRQNMPGAGRGGGRSGARAKAFPWFRGPWREISLQSRGGGWAGGSPFARICAAAGREAPGRPVERGLPRRFPQPRSPRFRRFCRRGQPAGGGAGICAALSEWALRGHRPLEPQPGAHGRLCAANRKPAGRGRETFAAGVSGGEHSLRAVSSVGFPSGNPCRGGGRRAARRRGNSPRRPRGAGLGTQNGKSARTPCPPRRR